jgi:hypothetical protein
LVTHATRTSITVVGWVGRWPRDRRGWPRRRSRRFLSAPADKGRMEGATTTTNWAKFSSVVNRYLVALESFDAQVTTQSWPNDLEGSLRTLVSQDVRLIADTRTFLTLVRNPLRLPRLMFVLSTRDQSPMGRHTSKLMIESDSFWVSCLRQYLTTSLPKFR